MFVFFHIPKAAGTTIRELISEQLRPSRSLHIDDVSRIAYQSDQWLNQHDFISGHFGAAIIPRLRPGTKKFTMLRNPVARVRSQFKYFKYLASMDVAFNGYNTLLRGRDLQSLLDDRSDPLINSLFRDTETWALAVDHQHHYRNFEASSIDVLRTAKNNLNAMDCFGIVENMPDSLRLLNTRFGFEIDLARAKYVRENESRKSAFAASEDSALDEIIRANNPLDVELYEWALEKFESEFLVHLPTTKFLDAELVEKPEIDLGLYSLGQTDIPSDISYSMLKERVKAAEQVNSDLSLRTIELQNWVEQAERKIEAGLANAKELRRWAVQSEATLATVNVNAEILRQWAEQSETKLVAERTLSRELRQWAEQSETKFVAERALSRQYLEYAEKIQEQLSIANERIAKLLSQLMSRRELLRRLFSRRQSID